jgi:flagellar hook protein FlgE
MDVIANNIANVNTIGYKASRVTFRDAFYQRLQGAAGPNPETGRAGTNPMQVGLGANIGSIDTLMTQGLSQRTDRSLDIMIQGEGFFIVRDATGMYFTRAGNVDIDGQMNLHINGMQLMGWDRRFIETTGEWVIETGPVVPLKLDGPKQYMEPQATTIIDMIGNLSPTGLINGQTTRTMDFTDTLGNRFVTDIIFTYHGEQEGTPGGDPIFGYWTYEFRTDDDGLVLAKDLNGEVKRLALHVVSQNRLGDIVAANNPTSAIVDDDGNITVTGPELMAKGVLVFDTNGKLVAADTLRDDLLADTATVPPMIDGRMPLRFDPAAISPLINSPGGIPSINISVAPVDALDPPATFGNPIGVPIVYDLGYTPVVGNNPANPQNKQFGLIQINLSDLTQWRGENISIKTMDKDGNPPGELRDISVGPDGKITGRYSNGKTRLLGQIPVARFQNPAGLEKMGNNLYAVTTNSGPFDGIGEAGDIMGGALEMSNVDLSQEFTDMITTQRGFQANSRVITVSDDMLQELVNLKR